MIGKWKALIKFDESARCVDREPKAGYAHPSSVLQTLSKLRVDKGVDEVSKKAIVAVDVGDITLVRLSEASHCTFFFKPLSDFLCRFSVPSSY